MFFGGNLVRQPAFVELKKQSQNSFRVVGDLAGADKIMNSALFLGVYPGLTPKEIEYVVDSIIMFCEQQ